MFFAFITLYSNIGNASSVDLFGPQVKQVLQGGAKNEICDFFLKEVLGLGPKEPKLPFDLLHRPVGFLG